MAEYSGVAASGALDQIAMTSGNTASVDSGPTGAVPAGELVYGALLTAFTPGSNATPGNSQGSSFTQRVNTGSDFEEDITSSAAGPQDATASFATGTTWYAVVATFQPTQAGAQPPSMPTGLKTTHVTSTQVSLSWTASTDDVSVTGYTVYRNGTSGRDHGGQQHQLHRHLGQRRGDLQLHGRCLQRRRAALRPVGAPAGDRGRDQVRPGHHRPE